MTETNPYKPPSSPVAGPERYARRPTTILVLALAALQVLVSAFGIPGALGLVRGGDIAPLAFLLFFISTVLIAVGGLVAIPRPRVGMYVFIGAVATGSLVLLQWAPLLAITAVVVAAAGAAACYIASRSMASESRRRLRPD